MTTKTNAIPLPVRVLGLPVLLFLILFGMRAYFGSLSDRPIVTIAGIAIVTLAWLSVVWPDGFRRRGV